jgi:hypothetical protein
MWKRIAILGVLVALAIWNPSNAVAQGWDGGGGGVTVSIGNLLGFHVGLPFPNRRPDFCCERRERRFFPRRVDCCEERRFFPRRVDCCEERRFFPRQINCCEERRFIPRRVFCCEDERRFFGRRSWGDDWDSDYTDGGYGGYE